MAALLIPPDVVALCARLGEAGFEAWVVGGAVRDLLRGATAKDFDVATSAKPAEVAGVFGRRRTIPTGEKHGTVTVLTERDGERQQVEVTTYRGEGGYSDGRHPDAVTFVSELEQDLERRDFTINAIAYDPASARLADPFGGRADLAARLIRAVGDPEARFREDGLRAMRAVRFSAQLEFRIDPPTEQAIAGALEIFKRVSAERVRDELLKILSSRRPSLGLEGMRRTGLLGATLPELLEGVGFAQNRHHAHDIWTHTLAAVDAATLAADPRWLVRLAALLHDVAKPRTAAPRPDAAGEHTFYRHEVVGAELTDQICRRLKLATKEREAVVNLVAHHMFFYTPEWSDGSVRRFIGRVGVEALEPLFALRSADIEARGRGEDPREEIAPLRARIDEELAKRSALTIGDLAVSGADVMEVLGIGPSPLIGVVLRRLLEQVLDDASLNQRETLRTLIPRAASA